MKRLQGILVLAGLLVCTMPASAQMIFTKKAKPNPSQRVPELILILKTEPDERKRASAAEEMRDYDATTFTEIVPILVDVLRQDKKMSVRLEAVNSLTKIRPVNALAGQALEKAAGDDESWRVRLQAKTALAKYYLAGYTAKKADAPPTVSKKKSTSEPPVANPLPPVSSTVSAPRPMPAPPASAAIPRPLPPGPPNPAPTAPALGPSLFP